MSQSGLPLENNDLLSSLKALDYRALADQAHAAHGPADRYAVLRATMVLGRYPEAAALLEEWSATLEPAVRTFLEIQLCLYRRENLTELALRMSQLQGLPDSAYFAGEYHFVFGYLHHLLDEYKPGSRHHRLAHASYLKAGLPACAAVALFNLCVGSNYLNCRSLLKAQVEELRRLVEAHPEAAVEALALQFESYLALEREDFSHAENLLRRLLARSQAEGRKREIGLAIWLLLYVLSKSGAESAREELRAEISALLPDLTTEHQAAVRALDDLNGHGLLEAQQAKRLLRSAKKSGVEAVPYFFLADLVVEKLFRSQEYEAAFKQAQRARQESLRSQRALALFDYRYLEAASLFRMGHSDRSSEILLGYRSDSRDRESPLRVQRADSLLAAIAQSQSGNERRLILSVSTVNQEVRMGDRRIPLTRQPLLFRLLCMLAKERVPLAVPTLFRRLYAVEFHLLRHDSRLNSLLGRARRVLGDPAALQRIENRVQFASHIDARLDTAPSGEQVLQWRRQQLLTAVRESPTPVAISELEKGFKFTRRTLQLDLDALLRQGLIGTNGGTRGRRYFGERSL